MTAPRLLRAQGGASAAEFALVLPLVLLLLFGIIDSGRYIWQVNELEKAVQLGARRAVVTDIVAGGLDSADYVGTDCGGTPIAEGDTICAAALGTVTCDGTSCTCATSPCPDLGDYDTAAFAAILARMQSVAPEVSADTVTVSYSGSGVGYAGDPATDDDGDPLSDIAPVVTVRVSQLDFEPIAGAIFGAGIGFPAISYSLTQEDGEGQVSS